MSIQNESFGERARLFTLENSSGTRLVLTDIGASAVSLVWRGTDILLGWEDPDRYFNGEGCHGATIGRVANRVADSRFVLNGKTYELVKEKREQRKLEKEFNLSVAKTDEYRCKKDEMEVVMATVAHDIETRDFEELDETLYEKTLQLNASVADFLKKEAREEFSYDADSATQVMQRFHIA